MLRDLTLQSPINALRDISNDIFSERPIRLLNGRELTALELQEELCERAESFVETHDLPKDQKDVVGLWRETLEMYRKDPLSLHLRSDWAAKYVLMEQLMSRDGLEITDPKIAMIDLLYHDTNPQRGLYYRLQNKGQIENIVSLDEINEAVTTPPQTTRARMRGAFVKRGNEQKRDFTVDWVHLKLNDQLQRTLLLKDPFKSHDDRFERLLNSL